MSQYFLILHCLLNNHPSLFHDHGKFYPTLGIKNLTIVFKSYFAVTLREVSVSLVIMEIFNFFFQFLEDKKRTTQVSVTIQKSQHWVHCSNAKFDGHVSHLQTSSPTGFLVSIGHYRKSLCGLFLLNNKVKRRYLLRRMNWQLTVNC